MKLIRLAAVSYTIWMIWRVRNFDRFKQGFSPQFAISTIKRCVRMSGMDTAKQMKTDMNEFIVSKYFDINTRREKYILYTGSLRFPDIG